MQVRDHADPLDPHRLDQPSLAAVIADPHVPEIDGLQSAGDEHGVRLPCEP